MMFVTDADGVVCYMGTPEAAEAVAAEWGWRTQTDQNPNAGRKDSMSEDRSLYAERRCAVCGFWRGQHIGDGTKDSEMRCPTRFTRVGLLNVEEDE